MRARRRPRLDKEQVGRAAGVDVLVHNSVRSCQPGVEKSTNERRARRWDACENGHVGKFLRRGLVVGALAGMGYAAWRALEGRRQGSGLAWQPQPFPYPPSATDKKWTDPLDGGCPDGFPVKAKLSSGIYHEPGTGSYERTMPDRCYRDAAAAEADGLRASKR